MNIYPAKFKKLSILLEKMINNESVFICGKYLNEHCDIAVVNDNDRIEVIIENINQDGEVDILYKDNIMACDTVKDVDIDNIYFKK